MIREKTYIYTVYTPVALPGHCQLRGFKMLIYPHVALFTNLALQRQILLDAMKYILYRNIYIQEYIYIEIYIYIYRNIQEYIGIYRIYASITLSQYRLNGPCCYQLILVADMGFLQKYAQNPLVYHVLSPQSRCFGQPTHVRTNPFGSASKSPKDCIVQQAETSEVSELAARF